MNGSLQEVIQYSLFTRMIRWSEQNSCEQNITHQNQLGRKYKNLILNISLTRNKLFILEMSILFIP